MNRKPPLRLARSACAQWLMKPSHHGGPMLARRRSTVLIALAVAAVVITAIFVASRFPIAPAPSGNNPTPAAPNPTPSACPRSVGLCIERNVTRVIDGDTLDVEGSIRIRLVLVNAPELNAA